VDDEVKKRIIDLRGNSVHRMQPTSLVEEVPRHLAKAIRAFIQFAASREIKPLLFQLAKHRLGRRTARSLRMLAAFIGATIALAHSVAKAVKHQAPPDEKRVEYYQNRRSACRAPLPRQ
jgi:hypothetical protein